MQNLEAAPITAFGAIDMVLTDVDDTLTRDGRLEGRTLDALDRLRRHALRVIPVTAASAGWASLIAHMWPVDGVIAENGGLFFRRQADGRVLRRYLDGGDERAAALSTLRRSLLERHPFLQPAEDQPYRETSLAFDRPSPEQAAAVLASLAEFGGGGTVNSLWLVAWPGLRGKLTATRRVLSEDFGLDIDTASSRVLYVGDSENDQPMFAHFPCTVGVSTVIRHHLEHWPRWITAGPGGEGFVEVVERLIAVRAQSRR